MTGHVYSPFIVIASKKWFDTLSPADKAAVKAAAVEAGVYQRQQQREQAVKLVDALKAKGMQVNELSPAEANRMREKLGAVNASIAANVGEALWKDTQAAVAAARK